MSTLGREALKKTLERLKKQSFGDTQIWLNLVGKLLERYTNMDEGEQGVFDIIFHSSHRAIRSLLTYIQTLEDYGYELDDSWNELLKSAEQTQKEKEEKEETKKTSYIK